MWKGVLRIPASFVRAGIRSKKLVARRLFEACLREGNPQAIYYDSLNRLVNGGDFHGCVNGLSSIAGRSPMASLTAAIFFVCKGETKKASEMFHMFIKLSGVSFEDPGLNSLVMRSCVTFSAANPTSTQDRT
ncbi:unnamed protein product [Microthlaspi erraticum]|uniref:Pentacotripeptide-repeat region of PRORP domain-containing protein n=1 Tax=Microthlaspi erraticum TaxID=1685480 RepID=A0A6D2I3D2_9BRAS|nr:unnamed protein product [Microthlaspi erraticum]